MNIDSRRKLFFRLVLSLGIAFLFGLIVSEISFNALTKNTERESQIFEILIPPNTAQRVEMGYPIPSIPEEMIFFEGDKIIVTNDDTVSHQLGPIWVPAGSSGTLTLDSPKSYSLACTFQPSKVMGLEVRPRLTNNIRFQGILAIGLPSGILIWLFSIVIFPIDSQNDKVPKING